MKDIFSIENWWRWVIVIALVVGAFFFLRHLAKQLFGKPKLNEAGLDENEIYHNVSTKAGDKRIDVASMDSGTNPSTTASIVIDAAVML